MGAILTDLLIRARISPNAISVVSVVFAAAGAAILVYAPNEGGLIATAACVQLRLLCNFSTAWWPSRAAGNRPPARSTTKYPDRFADSLFIVALGYSIGLPWLGWFGALAAAVTAYIRVLGGTLGLPQDFRGPLAKPHRMAVLTARCARRGGMVAGGSQSGAHSGGLDHRVGCDRHVRHAHPCHRRRLRAK